MVARSSNSAASLAPIRIRAPVAGLSASYRPRRQSRATGAPDLARRPTSGPASVRHHSPASRTGRVRSRAAAAIRSTGSSRPPPATERAAASGSAMPLARATWRKTAYTASSPASPRALKERSRRPIESSSAWSARSRTASPARIPAAARSSWARSSRSTQPSTAVSRRYCWSTRDCHSAPSTSRSAAASAANSAPSRTLPGGTSTHSTSSSAGPDPAAGPSACGAANSTASPRPSPSPTACSSGPATGSYPGYPSAPCGAYSSRSGRRRTAQREERRPTRVWRGPSTAPSRSVPASRRPR